MTIRLAVVLVSEIRIQTTLNIEREDVVTVAELGVGKNVVKVWIVR